MKRFHVHVSVTDLKQSIAFYSRLFGTNPSVSKPDYAKWMLDDPRVNFAISERDSQPGVNHLGIQVEEQSEFEAMQAQLLNADNALIAEIGTTCCYAQSDKYWITDPQGIAWETFRTLGSAPVYGHDAVELAATTSCCLPASNASCDTPKTDASFIKAAACCGPTSP